MSSPAHVLASVTLPSSRCSWRVSFSVARRSRRAEAILAPLTDDADKPRAASAWAWIGVSRLARGDRRGATEAAHEALAIDRDDPVAHNIIAKAH